MPRRRAHDARGRGATTPGRSRRVVGRCRARPRCSAPRRCGDAASVATFGSGCFCTEPPFDDTAGALSTVSAYMGGALESPSDEQVSAGGTGHVEVVQVTYDPDEVDHATLLDLRWRNVDPLTANRQFCDAGSASLAHDTEPRELAAASRRAPVESGRFEDPIVTEIAEASAFRPAEDCHPDHDEKNPIRYKRYRTARGRDRRLQEVRSEG